MSKVFITMKNIVFITNSLLLISLIIIWIIELFETKHHNSLLFSRNSIIRYDEIPLFAGITILTIVGLLMIIFGIKRNFIFAEIISIAVFSISILIIVRNLINSYLPWNVSHYESFVGYLCFLIYYSMASLIIAFGSGIYLLLNKMLTAKQF